MANIKRDELNFLISLCDKIRGIADMDSDATQLSNIVSRLSAAEEAKSRRAWDTIKKKRETDPAYGRSNVERERIESKTKKENIFNHPGNQFSQSGVVKIIVDDMTGETANFRYDICIDGGTIRRFIVKHKQKTVYIYPEIMPEDSVISTAIRWCIREFKLYKINGFQSIERS
jgi:hypothetical protein